MLSLKRRRHGSKLFALYVLASLVPISVIGTVSMRGDANAGAQFGNDWGRAQAAVIEQMAIAPALRGADLSQGLDKAERGRLQSATDLAIFNGTVSHLLLAASTAPSSSPTTAAWSIPCRSAIRDSGPLPPGAPTSGSSPARSIRRASCGSCNL